MDEGNDTVIMIFLQISDVETPISNRSRTV